MDTSRIKILKLVFLILSIGLLAASLTQKCYCSNACGDSVVVFFLGFFSLLGVFSGCLSGFCWLANPALIMAWIFLKKKPKLSFYFSLVSTFLALAFFFLACEHNFETGTCFEVTEFKAGYWLWLSSSVVNLAGNLILRFLPEHKEE